MDVSGKGAIVFGGARGIGEACVTRLLEKGAKVCIADVNAELGAATVEKLQVAYPESVIFVPCDITEDQQVEDVFSATCLKFGSVEICVDSAGICNEVDYKKTISVNLVGAISVTRIAQQRMGTNTGNKGGVVIIMSSVGGCIPVHGMASYCASKAAIIQFVRCEGCADGLKHDGVRVNAICPNYVPTKLPEEMVPLPQHAGIVKTVLGGSQPNAITVDDVADAMMKLAEGEYNGTSLLFTKDGIQPFDEEERHKKIMESLYQGNPITV